MYSALYAQKTLQYANGMHSGKEKESANQFTQRATRLFDVVKQTHQSNKQI